MVEDNTVNQMVAKRLISKLGYRIDVVSSGEEAIEYIKRYDYDLVLMDQHMPEMEGIEATEEVHNFRPIKPQIFALTASAFSDYRDRCLAAGMNGFLTKSINMEQLIEAFKSCPPMRPYAKPIKNLGRSISTPCRTSLRQPPMLCRN